MGHKLQLSEIYTVYDSIQQISDPYESESEFCPYCKEIDAQVNALLYCPSTIQLWSNVEKWVRKGIQPHYKTCDWDEMFGNHKSSFIINAIILNTKK